MAANSARAACTPCTSFGPGVSLGTANVASLVEASGIAASRRNPGVFWTHNDGSGGNVYALGTNAARLATFNLTTSVDDTEDIAVGPGPVSGVSYLYIGDIGGNQGSATVRSEVKLIRLPEPLVDQAWAASPHSANFDGVETFTLTYPDGSYDAESLMVDPISGDVLIVTKQAGSARLYRANLAGLPDQSTVLLQFVVTVSFSLASAGDISADGMQIVLRREDFATSWGRCTNETVATALARVGQSIPVIGLPTEPNGEGIALLPDGTGYVTISEGSNPNLYFFQAQCPASPQFTVSPTDASGFVGGSAEFHAVAVGYPSPVYQWRFNNQVLPGKTASVLTLTNLTLDQTGPYQVTASNASASVTRTANLMVRSKPNLGITEVMSSEASSPGVPTADWWELTSYETQPVDLSGWRFNDSAGGLTDPFVLVAGLTIQPGESIVFTEGLTATQFRNWWGLTNLPAALQIISYSGAGLGLANSGDGIRLWNASATDAADTIASVDFGIADAGVSFNSDPVTRVFGGKSQLGVNGVIRASLATDLGSPGRTRAPASSPQLDSSLVGGKLRIEFNALAGYRYSVQTRSDVDSTTWELTGDFLQATNSFRAAFEQEVTGNRRFYRLLVE